MTPPADRVRLVELRVSRGVYGIPEAWAIAESLGEPLDDDVALLSEHLLAHCEAALRGERLYSDGGPT